VSLAMIGGLMGSPFWAPGDSQLVWDDELTFSGLAAKVRYAMGPASLFLNAGSFPVDSEGFGVDNPNLWSVQGGAAVSPFKDAEPKALKGLTVTAALSFHDYANTAKRSLTNDEQSGNSAQAEDFNELNPNLEVATQLEGVPVALWWDQVRNTSASMDENGFQIGLKVGKAKTPWSLKEGWEAGYAFERLEPNAVLDMFPNGDFGGGGTNHLGNTYWVKFATLKHSTAGLKIIQTREVTGTKNQFDTYQLDWITKF
jgi:hypothetical protein